MTQSNELPLTATQSDDLTAIFVARLKAHLASPPAKPELDIPPWDDPEEDNPSDQAPGLIPARSLLICLRPPRVLSPPQPSCRSRAPGR